MTSKHIISSKSDTSDRPARTNGWAVGASIAAAAGAAGFNAVNARRATEANPPLGEFVTVDGVKLHYLAKGRGPTVVLLHGNALMLEDWIASGLFDSLAKSTRVIAFDRPGFGHSERPRNVVWTPVAQARLIAGALAELGEEQVTVVGHSFGTMVAAELAVEHPELVASLVLIGGYYYPSARLDVAFSAPPAIPVVGDVMRYTVSPLLGAALKGRMERQIFGPAEPSSGWRTRFPFEMTLRPSQIRAAAADAGLMVPAANALSKRLSDLSMPVTIIAGDCDRIVDPKAQSARLASEIEQSELILVEGAGHMVHHSAESPVLEAIRAAVR